MTEPLALEIRNLTAGYGRTTVLRDISLSLPRGTVSTLLGPNGAGKTTLLRTVAGLLSPTHGQILLAGQDLSSAPASKRAKSGICLIPEGRGVFKNLTVRENLALLTPPGKDSDRVNRALDAFPILKEKLNQLAGRLSGGQQQMLSVSRCYLADPSVLLIDEVSMGLAPQIMDQIFASLMGLAAEGIAILLVEQYVTKALEMATEVAVLNHGAIVFAGPVSEIDEETIMRGYLGAPAVPS